MIAMPELKVLFSREQIAHRVAEMGAEINRDYAGQSVILLGVLKGAAIFLSDLSRHVDLMPLSTLSAFPVTASGRRGPGLEGTGTRMGFDR